MVLPSEKLAELRQLIHNQVSQLGIQDEIRGCVDSLGRDDAGGRTLDEEALMSALEERGVVDRVMQSLNLSEDTGGGEPCVGGDAKPPLHIPNKETPCKEVGKSPQKASLSPNRRYLFLQALGGRAFLEHLQDAESPCLSTFTLHIHFRGQRFRSRPFPCACEPRISEGFLLELTKGDRDGRMASYTDALSMAELVHVVLTRTNRTGEVDLVGTCHLQWRQVLADGLGRSSLSVELSGVGSEAATPAGILDLKLEILPRSREALHGDIVSGQIAMEKQRAAEKERLFLVYAKQWWKEFLQIRASHSQRLVKIFAQDESGKSRPVCSYVRPLRAGRLLDGPRHAARFVSLIPFERAGSVGSGGCCSEVWSSLHVLLSRKKGECEDHAVLLCSLLLGFGLDSYVCIGTKAKGLAHAWVLTLGHDGSATFWESLTGQRFLHPEFDPNARAGRPVPPPPHPYRTLGCLFNHKAFLANAQPSDSVLTCRFDLHNGALWKAMSPEAIKSVTQGALPPGGRFLPPLLPARADPSLVASQLEAELRTLAAQHREDLGLRTVWDDDLSYLLSPALAAYELERCVGVSAGNEEFQEAVRSAVPKGHTFKGFPIQLVHRNARKAFHACLRSPVCSGILGCRGDHVRLAVRVRVFTYPEDISAVWIMFAVKYQSVV